MSPIEEWHADIHITEELVISCLQGQFPALLPIKKIKCIGEGWDNKVFLINEKIIFRFPRRKIAVALIERENAVLNKLPIFPGVSVPIPKYVGYPTIDYPYSFQGYALIIGISAYQAKLNDQDRIASLPILAGFLKQLHSIDVTQALAMGAEPQVFDRTLTSKTIEILQGRITKIIARKCCNINLDCFQQEVAAVKNLLLPESDRCLVHGDLDCRHLIFNENQLTGIIDWGDMGINHKSVDLAIIWSFYPSSCHSQFFEIYGAVDLATWQYARFLGLYCAFTELLYGTDMDDVLLVTEAVNAIKRINVNLLTD